MDGCVASNPPHLQQPIHSARATSGRVTKPLVQPEISIVTPIRNTNPSLSPSPNCDPVLLSAVYQDGTRKYSSPGDSTLKGGSSEVFGAHENISDSWPGYNIDPLSSESGYRCGFSGQLQQQQLQQQRGLSGQLQQQHGLLMQQQLQQQLQQLRLQQQLQQQQLHQHQLQLQRAGQLQRHQLQRQRGLSGQLQRQQLQRQRVLSGQLQQQRELSGQLQQQHVNRPTVIQSGIGQLQQQPVNLPTVIQSGIGQLQQPSDIQSVIQRSIPNTVDQGGKTNINNDRKPETEAQDCQRAQLEQAENAKQFMSKCNNSVQHNLSCLHRATCGCIHSHAVGSYALMGKKAPLHDILASLQCLSDILLSSHYDASEFKDCDNELLQLVTDKLGAFIIEINKAGDISPKPEHAGEHEAKTTVTGSGEGIGQGPTVSAASADGELDSCTTEPASDDGGISSEWEHVDEAVLIEAKTSEIQAL